MGRGIFHRLEKELVARERSPGLSVGDMMDLPDLLADLCSWMLRRQQVSMPEVLEFLGRDEQRARQALDELLERGFIREVAIGKRTYYQVRLAPTKKRDIPLDIWQALQDKVEE